ncbi:MAG: hypothetical protein IJ071_08985 [Ruminococcus sp.]|nr:hypothetical protein [Ruminococcus sp.]
MFKKVQLRFFSIIAGILLAIFVAVLVAINVIMDTVMERQSMVVLKQIAAGVEYDSTAGEFSFERPKNNGGMHWDDRQEPPPEKPTGEMPTRPEEDETDPPTEQPTTTAPPTEAETDPPTEEIFDPGEDDPGEPPEDQPDEPEPREPDAPSTEAPRQDDPTAPPQVAPTEPPAVVQPPTKPAEPERPERPDDDDRPKPDDDDRDDDKHEQWGPWGPWGWGWGWEQYGSEPDDFGDDDDAPELERTAFGSILDGLSITAEAETVETTTAAVTAKSGSSTTVAAGQNKNGGQPAQNGGEREPVPKSLGSIDFFVMMADDQGNFVRCANNDDLAEDDAQDYITTIMASGESSGMMDNYQFVAAQKDNGTLMVLTDKSAEIDMLKKLTRITVIVGLISVIVLSAVAFYLSGLIVKPIQETFDKQKQFISDASHELKTPLTVISANADVLEGEIGDNKWLNYIQDQADRMNVLVNDLLSLTRLENSTTQFIQTEFDLSRAMMNTALPFECKAFETNKNFVLNIEEGIQITGSEQHIKQMAAIFIDNALKYSKDGGTVRVSLTKENDKTVFYVYNTGSGVKEEDKEKIFERFYRSDESRNRATGGYGLGLAIAKSIIDKHKFKVNVENVEGKSICFVVTM